MKALLFLLPTAALCADVTLQWDPSPEPTVLGYGLYRSYRPNLVQTNNLSIPFWNYIPVPSTNFTYKNLSPGHYYFSIYSIGTESTASTVSDPIYLHIPSPSRVSIQILVESSHDMVSWLCVTNSLMVYTPETNRGVFFRTTVIATPVE